VRAYSKLFLVIWQKKSRKSLQLKRNSVTLQAKRNKNRENDDIYNKLLVVAQLKISTIVRR
jgi:hypothetical protein